MAPRSTAIRHTTPWSTKNAFQPIPKSDPCADSEPDQEDLGEADGLTRLSRWQDQGRGGSGEDESARAESGHGQAADQALLVRDTI